MTDTTPRSAVLSWDYREQIPLDLLAEALADLSGGTLHLREAETDSDQYAVVIATVPLAEQEATEIFRTWRRHENEPT